MYGGTIERVSGEILDGLAGGFPPVFLEERLERRWLWKTARKTGHRSIFGTEGGSSIIGLEVWQVEESQSGGILQGFYRSFRVI
jgi:hypothetical protein